MKRKLIYMLGLFVFWLGLTIYGAIQTITISDQAQVTPPVLPSAVLQDPRYQLGYIVVSHYPGVYTNGTGDSTVGIQQAIDDAYELNKIVLFSPGTYLISDTLKCYRWGLWDFEKKRHSNIDQKRCHTLLGSKRSPTRPIIKLVGSAPLFDDAEVPRPLISFRVFRGLNKDATDPVAPASPMGNPKNFRDCSADLFNDDLRGIDFDCNGHAGAVGVYFPAAQNATMEDIRVDATDSYAGIWGVPGRDSGAMNVEVEGGRFGLMIEGSIGGTVLTGIRLFNQTEAAFINAASKYINVLN